VSRAFVKEDDHEPEPDFRLPDRDSPYYDEAAAWALIQGANEGNTRSAELATGYRWGDPLLVEHIGRIFEKAETEREDRVAQLSRRFLKAAGQSR
jgi:hypothetical protein